MFYLWTKITPSQHFIFYSYLIVGVVRWYLDFNEFGENYDESIRKSTMNWYARTNSRFVTFEENYVTMHLTN
jgi:hypothetical protein